ncbi:methionine--tRNA ligase, partial [Pseudomonas syringae pv. tagetis]
LASFAAEESEGVFGLAHFLEWRGEVFKEFFPALVDAGKNRDDSLWRGLCGADAGLLKALRVELNRATEPGNFSMKYMALVLLD